jgi:hypothetical protein
VYLIDNSTDVADIQIKIVDGVVIYKKSQVSEWVMKAITTVEMIMQRNIEK